MKIRKAENRDIVSIVKLNPLLHKDVIEKRIKDQSDGKSEFLILEDNGEIKSFVYLKYFGKNTHLYYPDIENLFTIESDRGKGYGRKLIAKCEELAKEKGFNKIGLAVNPHLNLKVKTFYESLGYKYDGRKEYIDGVYNGIEDWVVDLEKEI